MAKDPTTSRHPEDNCSPLAGLPAGAIVRLRELKQQIAVGERSELTFAHKYLLFLKYLVESDGIDGEEVH
jgi:hypothetical protein